jgi:hypothetical protein
MRLMSFPIPSLAGRVHGPRRPEPALGEPHHSDRSVRSRGEPHERGALLRVVNQRTEPILIAGSDATKRARLTDELSRELPRRTAFIEASTAWEVLERAPGCMMVMLTDDLDDRSADSIMRLLSRRHPALPVLAC